MQKTTIKSIQWIFFIAMCMSLFGCKAPQEQVTVLEPQQIKRKEVVLKEKKTVSIGKFSNRSTYMTGVFAGEVDRLGLQARQILKNHLSQSKSFLVMDRVNMEELKRESGYSNTSLNIQGSKWVVTGAITEFGRKEVGTHALGGLAGKTKSQIAYGKVSLSVVDVTTSAVLYSSQGAGEYALKQGEVLGFGSSAGFDATLTDKVINLAMMEAVDRLIEQLAAEES